VLREAKGCGHNNFKVELAQRTIVRALRQAAAATPQDQSDKIVR
jgi:xanthine dehydrogenase YagS FAD-binding subunit